MERIFNREDWRSRLQMLELPTLTILAVLYFTCNTMFLPHGISVVLLFGLVTLPLALIGQSKISRFLLLYLLLLFLFREFQGQLYAGYFARSSLIFLGLASLFLALDRLMSHLHDWRSLLNSLSLLNVILLAGFLLLWFTPWRDSVWWTFFLSSSVGQFTRLKGLSYEPSYYALSLAPLFLYQFSGFLKADFGWKRIILLAGISLGLVFSFSFGVLGGLILAIGFSYLYFLHKPEFVRETRKLVILIICLGLGGFTITYFLFPSSVLFVRLGDLINGRDLSGNSRLFDSFLLSFQILGPDRIWLGLGPGQLKMEGYSIIKAFYNYTWQDSWAPAMPNSITDWLCSFGLIGVSLKLGTEVYLFFNRKVYLDFFRLSCFVFIFIYQFTGGYLFCLPELVLWAIAFALHPMSRDNIGVSQGKLTAWSKLAPFMQSPWLGRFVIAFFFTGIFLPNGIWTVSLILLLLYFLPQLQFNTWFKTMQKDSVALFQVLFFLFTAISVLWSSNMSDFGTELQSKLPFLMVPLILNQSNKGLFGWSTFFLKTIYLLGIIISFCCLIQAAFFSPSGFQWDNFIYEKLAMLSGLQPIYLSLFLILSSLSWYQLFLLGDLKKSRIHFVSPVFLYLMVVLLSSRTELMVYVGGFLLILLRHFRGRKIIIISSVLLFSLLTVVVILCSKTNASRFAEMVDIKSDYKSNKWGGRSLRIEKWRNTLECYMNFPILGTGAGDCGDELRKTYQKNNFEIALKANYNPHNQFLQTLLTLGPIGLFFLLGIFGSILRRADRNQDFPLFLLVIVFAFSMITESMLERQSGIFLFTVLTCFFAAVSKSQEAEFAVEN